VKKRLSRARTHPVRVLIPRRADDGDQRADDNAEQHRSERDFQRISKTGHEVFPAVIFYEVQDKLCLELCKPLVQSHGLLSCGRTEETAVSPAVPRL